MKNSIYILGFSILLAACQKSTNTVVAPVTPVTQTPVTQTPVASAPTIANQLKFSGNGFIHNGTYPKLYLSLIHI